MVGLMTTLRECADTAAAALVDMLRSAKGAVDAAAVADVIEQVLNQATSETEEGAELRKGAKKWGSEIRRPNGDEHSSAKHSRPSEH